MTSIHPDFHTSGFTLAEVLITLGIIGIVAALTLPTLIQHHKKTEVETKLAKFYSVMNQAIQRSELDNGPKEYWEKEPTYRDEDTDNHLAWFKKYIGQYLDSNVEVTISDAGNILLVSFPDGSLCAMNRLSWSYWLNAKNFDGYEKDTDTGNLYSKQKLGGRKSFTFIFAPQKEYKYTHNKGMEPYITNTWNGTRETLFTNSSAGCQETVSDNQALCTKLIQLNGWKIPEDYPFKF